MPVVLKINDISIENAIRSEEKLSSSLMKMISPICSNSLCDSFSVISVGMTKSTTMFPSSHWGKKVEGMCQ